MHARPRSGNADALGFLGPDPIRDRLPALLSGRLDLAVLDGEADELGAVAGYGFGTSSSHQTTPLLRTMRNIICCIFGCSLKLAHQS